MIPLPVPAIPVNRFNVPIPTLFFIIPFFTSKRTEKKYTEHRCIMSSKNSYRGTFRSL